MDPYETLGVNSSASLEAICAAYRQQMALYHPDKVAGLGGDLRRVAETRAKDINAAYAILGNPAARAVHDRQREYEEAKVINRIESPPAPPPRPAVVESFRLFGRWSLTLIDWTFLIGLGGFAMMFMSGWVRPRLPDGTPAIAFLILGSLTCGGLLAFCASLFLLLRSLLWGLRALSARYFWGWLLMRVVQVPLASMFVLLLLGGLSVLLGLPRDQAGVQWWGVSAALILLVFAVLGLGILLAPRLTERCLARVPLLRA